ncbi:dihydroorotase [Candidatus Thermokryptus mobilis]|uniref:Dihydroorotase n=1 Tax=Candidatus Thermokryptus mobilis TaxID=1643428 RepID=A0A0S4MVC7_9BACT|nr:dihydroorotase [Candidatus Thermokryptus mobilis]CUU02504.1 dihydroorotase [Candidatus Thermokryptus mobilis]
MKILFKNARIINPAQKLDEIADILIVDGKIEKIGKIEENENFQVYDFTNKIISPGFIDMHVHLREPGFEHKETIKTGIEAGANGGFTALCCMPNTNPTADDPSVIEYVKKKSKEALGGIVDVYPIGAITKRIEGLELAPIAELVEAGAIAFSDDGNCVQNSSVMRKAFEYISMFDKAIIQHCEDKTLSGNGLANEGYWSTILGLTPYPDISEEIILYRDLRLLSYLKPKIKKEKYHIAHISSRGSIELLKKFKDAGLNITAEVTPHHLLLTDEDIWKSNYDTNLKVNPPLKSGDDVDALVEALKDGTIDAIASDHAPHAPEEKESDFASAPFGIIGLETTVGLILSEFVNKGIITIHKMIELLSINPRKILGLEPVKISEGEKANLTLLDPNLEWIVDERKFKSKSKNSPFIGWKLKGKPLGIINNGKVFWSSL